MDNFLDKNRTLEIVANVIDIISDDYDFDIEDAAVFIGLNKHETEQIKEYIEEKEKNKLTDKNHQKVGIIYKESEKNELLSACLVVACDRFGWGGPFNEITRYNMELDRISKNGYGWESLSLEYDGHKVDFEFFKKNYFTDKSIRILENLGYKLLELDYEVKKPEIQSELDEIGKNFESSFKNFLITKNVNLGLDKS